MERAGAPSSCWLKVDGAGRPRAIRERSSGCGGNPADVGPRLKRTHHCESVSTGGDVVTAEMEEVAIWSWAERKRCACRADLKRFICRPRRRVGWCEFSARLFRPLC
jgi:hypothetical protein